MSQSCETLITKINEWQQAILELEKLSNEFLNTGDEKIKTEIDAMKQEIKKNAEEYQELAYPELLSGENLFLPERTFLKEFYTSLSYEHLLEFKNTISSNSTIKTKNNHVNYWSVSVVSREFKQIAHFTLNLSLFQSLKIFRVSYTEIEKFPIFPQSIKEIHIQDCENIQIPDDLTHLKNLEKFCVSSSRIKKFPKLPQSIKGVDIQVNDLSDEEKQRIIKEYPNVKITF